MRAVWTHLLLPNLAQLALDHVAIRERQGHDAGVVDVLLGQPRLGVAQRQEEFGPLVRVSVAHLSHVTQHVGDREQLHARAEHVLCREEGRQKAKGALERRP